MIKQSQRGFIVPLIIIIAAALAIGGGVYYSKTQTPTEVVPEPVVSTEVTNSNSFTTAPATDTASTTASTTVSVGAATTGTLGSLFAMNSTVKCTFSSTGAGASAGTVYIAGTMMRGDFTLQGQAASEAHMIRSGDEVYVWSGAQGAKMAMSAMSGSGANARTGVDLNQNVSYKCDPWTKEDARFTRPANVNFTDLAAMVQTQVGAGVTSGR